MHLQAAHNLKGGNLIDRTQTQLTPAFVKEGNLHCVSHATDRASCHWHGIMPLAQQRALLRAHRRTLLLAGDAHPVHAQRALTPLRPCMLAPLLLSAAYQRLETCARKLTLETVQRYLKMMHIEDEKILNRFKEFEAHGSQTPGNEVWSFFQEDQLSNDNKLVDNRLNLITKAMAALTALPARLKSTWRKGKSLQWHLLREHSPGANPKQKWMAAGPTEWTAAMSELCNDATYTKDQDLFLFDFCCNIVANETTETYCSVLWWCCVLASAMFSVYFRVWFWPVLLLVYFRAGVQAGARCRYLALSHTHTKSLFFGRMSLCVWGRAGRSSHRSYSV